MGALTETPGVCAVCLHDQQTRPAPAPPPLPNPSPQLSPHCLPPLTPHRSIFTLSPHLPPRPPPQDDISAVYQKIEEGADVNFVFGSAYSCPEGYTCLMVAAHRGRYAGRYCQPCYCHMAVMSAICCWYC